MTFSERLAALRVWMQKHGVQAYLVTSADAHQSEDCPDHDRTLAWLTGFSGSLGRALIFADRAVLFVDGRYQVQAAQQVDQSLWSIAHLNKTPPETVLAECTSPLSVGYAAMLWSVNQVKMVSTEITPLGHRLIPVAHDPFDDIWADRPASPCGVLRQMPDAVAGETGASKRGRLRARLRALGLGAWVMTRPDDIAWLTNTRGSDIAMHPVPLSFAILPSEGPMIWAIHPDKIDQGNVSLDPDVKQIAPAGFLDHVTQISNNNRIGLDPAFAAHAVEDAIVVGGGTAVHMDDPVTVMKAAKNAVELAGYRDAHLKDGLAWTTFMAWLSDAVPARFDAGRPVTECEAADKVLALRAAQEGFLEASFNSISAAGSNAAMCHYAPNREDEVPVVPTDLYLLDSGGQYANGTTDATRTLAFADLPDETRQICTAVLKGFIGLSNARFPDGSFPHQLDALARAPLWALGLDYDHGTGHGVGHNLLVHEFPQRFGKLANAYPLHPGHIMTIEPGYYLEGQFGLRIENQVEVIADPDAPGYLRFAPLTCAPIPLSLFDLAALSDAECAWLDAYHADVRARLSGQLSQEASDWMMAQTEPCARQMAKPPA